MHSPKVHSVFHGTVHRKVLTDQVSLFIDRTVLPSGGGKECLARLVIATDLAGV